MYQTQMQNIFNLANSTHGLNDACIAAQAPGDEWKCNFAQYSYAYTKSDTFPLNSALDSWQTGCIYTSELPPGFPHQTTTANGICGAAGNGTWSACSGNPESCNATQMKVMNTYITDFMGAIKATKTYSKTGNGAFLHSCHTHCEAQGDQFFSFSVNGKTMQQAVSAWWNSDGKDPADSHHYEPCTYHTDSSPHKCNPTC